MSTHDPEKLKAFWEYMETWKGWAKALLVGNGAGLGYCLTTLNSSIPRYRVGDFIALFGIGFVLAGVYLFVLTILKAEVTSAIVTQQRPGQTLRGMLLEYSALGGMWGSAGCFVLAILLFVYRFWSL